MYAIGIIAMLVGAVGALLAFSGFDSALPVDLSGVPFGGWIATLVVGVVLWRLGRRPGD